MKAGSPRLERSREGTRGRSEASSIWSMGRNEQEREGETSRNDGEIWVGIRGEMGRNMGEMCRNKGGKCAGICGKVPTLSRRARGSRRAARLPKWPSDEGPSFEELFFDASAARSPLLGGVAGAVGPLVAVCGGVADFAGEDFSAAHTPQRHKPPSRPSFLCARWFMPNPHAPGILQRHPLGRSSRQDPSKIHLSN